MAQRFSPELLRSLREATPDPDTGRPVTREELGRRVGRGYFSIYRYEAGLIVPPLDVAARLAAALDVDVADLFEDVPAAVGGDARMIAPELFDAVRESRTKQDFPTPVQDEAVLAIAATLINAGREPPDEPEAAREGGPTTDPAGSNPDARTDLRHSPRSRRSA